MDLIKIGKYLAAKRKALGLTQKQLAEKLNMSDKSVSKWERGVCLPDVSVYMELCGILGISINEFLAGEDIERDLIGKKSEENLVQISIHSKVRQSKLRNIITLLLIFSFSAIFLIFILLFPIKENRNYIIPLERDSVEMQTAQILSGPEGAFIFEFETSEEFAAIKLHISEYHSDVLVAKENLMLGYEGISSPAGGTILIVPDFENFLIRIFIVDGSSKYSTEIPILEGVSDRQYYGRSSVQLEENVPIVYGSEHALLALLYDNDTMRVTSIEEYADGILHRENDFVYFFSVEFTLE